MMAHNLCYSTLLSREAAARLPASEVLRSPTGDAFVRKDLAVGILPEILEELLAARKRAKKDLKEATDPFDKAVLDGRQLVRRERQRVFFFFREREERKDERTRKRKNTAAGAAEKKAHLFFLFPPLSLFPPSLPPPTPPNKNNPRKKNRRSRSRQTLSTASPARPSA